MKNIFEQKLNKAIYFTKPVEFLEIRSSGSQIYLTSRNTYAVWHKKKKPLIANWHKKKKIKGAMTNVFWLQSARYRGTRTFDFFLKASDVCMNIKEALPIVKIKRMQYSEQRILDLERMIKVNKLYLKNSDNFNPTVGNGSYGHVEFPKLNEIRNSI